MPWVAGVDGCPAGWVVALVQQQPQGKSECYIKLCNRFAEVLTVIHKPIVTAVDMPIGLRDEQQPGGRACDQQARQMLGRRACTVFSPPPRPLLTATEYEQVRSHGVSIQAFCIRKKIYEVDCLMTPQLQTNIYEAHPELAFRSLTGAPMQYNKKTLTGREQRLRALEQASGGLFSGIRNAYESALLSFKRSQVAPDDLLDAYVLSWLALRISNGQANRVPSSPPIDEKGLRMEIWY